MCVFVKKDSFWFIMTRIMIQNNKIFMQMKHDALHFSLFLLFVGFFVCNRLFFFSGDFVMFH